jgi:enoyl-CoA hydratase
MEFANVLYEIDGAVAVITLNRPQYRNAQSYHLLDDLDAALDAAAADHEVKVIIVRGAGGNFSSGHDLGTPEQVALRQERGIPESGIGFYDSFRHYNYDITLKWRNLPKPTIAMVEGFCIYGGWMIAAAMDLVFAAPDALFLAGLVEYYCIPFDVGVRKAKELLFESRFITAEEARDVGFVSRVMPKDRLFDETMNYARRCAENSHMVLRMAKLATNKIQDLGGYTTGVEGAFADYLVTTQGRGSARVEGERRLLGVDLALRGLRGQRPGLQPSD